MSENEKALGVTIKAGAGYEVPWVTLRADNPGQLEQQLDSLSGELLQKITTVANLFQQVNTVTQGVAQPPSQAAPQAPAAPQQSSGGGWSQPAQQAPAPQQNNGVRLHPEGKACGACNSVLQYKEVTRKSDNKTFKFWACPNQRNRDDGHASEFAN